MSLFIQGNPALQEIERAMQAIGYRDELLRRSYEYEDVIVRHQHSNKIDLAGFAQNHPSYRNACIGVVVSNSSKGAALVAQHRALGAPLVFEIDGNTVNRWKVTASGDPELKERIPNNQIINAFRANRAEWEPESILRVKAIGERPGAVQLDFFDESLLPFLDGHTFSKLDHFLHRILTKTIEIYRRFNGAEPRSEDLFPLAFRFIAAKVFRDRNFPGEWFSNDAVKALRAVEKHYNTSTQELPLSEIYSPDVLNEVWKVVLADFHSLNVSEDALALTFEKTFIIPEDRKRLDVHSTPPRVVEYIVNKLPFHEIPQEDRYVLEPFAGHGRFLVSAMRRMHGLLGVGMSDAERHDYFRERLAGIEIDRFSVEICRLSLVLADFPNPNNWRIYPENVFATDTLRRELRRSRIVLSNPPYGQFTHTDRQKYGDPNLILRKPAEVLRRILSRPPELLGLVLPLIFESSSTYRPFHRQLAETYRDIELVSLPKVFNYSEATTMLVIASGRRSFNSQVAVTCRKISEGDEREDFLKYGIEPPAAKASISSDEYSRPNFSLWIPPLSRIWGYLQDYPKLSSEIEVHQGIKWLPASNKRGKKLDLYVSDKPKDGYHKGYARAEGHLFQYYMKGAPKYLSRRPEDQYDHAYKYAWHLPKVACNAARRRRRPWRVAAFADPIGMAFSQRFMAFWPSEKISIYALAALLNSPVCNAFLFATEGERSPNHKRTFDSLPLPPVSALAPGAAIDSLSRSQHNQLSRVDEGLLQGPIDGVSVKNMLLQIDAEILRAYDLPPNLERELLDTFEGIERPVPLADFNGYYPKDFEAYYPLHEIISEEFELARADKLMERLPMINDKDLGEYLDYLFEESSNDQ
jgi:hypothetical protein